MLLEEGDIGGDEWTIEIHSHLMRETFCESAGTILHRLRAFPTLYSFSALPDFLPAFNILRNASLKPINDSPF